MARPKFKPTEAQRRTVGALVAYGIDEIRIARVIGDCGIDPKTLRKHFRHELDIGAIRANAAVAQTLYQMATSGRHPAASMFWMKCRAGWKETNVLQHSGPDGGPIEISNEQLEKRITEELARLAASRDVASVPAPVEVGREEQAALPVEKLERQT